MTSVFNQSYAFYDPESELSDLIYTSDSRLIARPNAYLSLANWQNDLRQPLFAVFSAPFIAAPYAISLLFRIFAPYASFYFMNYVQIGLLVFTIILLARLISEKSAARACFALFLSFAFLKYNIPMLKELFAFASEICPR